MGVIKTKDDFKHPDGKIQLLNGTVLDCYLLEQPAAVPQSDAVKENVEKFFVTNAFRFLQYRDRIMSDSRMFLCPVPIQNGLACTGTSGFQRPTLGVYIEWWLNCESAMIFNGIGKKKLVYQIAGSPLSGSNHCGIVNENGETETESIQTFSSLWPIFMRINNRYDEAKGLYQAYTLEQVVEILDEESLPLIDDKELEIVFLKNALLRWRSDILGEINRLKDTIDRLKFQLFYRHRDELKAIMAIYEEKKEKKEQREKEINKECKELRRKLISGEIDNKQYQKRLTPLKKEKESNIYLLREYSRFALEPLFPDLGYNISDVEAFFKDPRSAGPLKPRG